MQDSTGALSVAIVEDAPRIQQLFYLRQKIEIDSNLSLIHTIRGVGFMLRAQTAT